ncbi:hypothetical protein W97_08640 [Coniosporium apollinis CBS 100218]|uniref:AMP-dependent synthetase/ligase domain-containing protein n=1 Tax=Coniosporium apollinis (strain CBS 100218) TaxID=1168221 RepID=R7Z5A9_CONA1|nr:uncharacterized protein W97_08640 [Coniosporium apollinis CBS 100218]EON69380.1 hypothetical protein W97_08640 [Coniosporium apollinis CBS 100218]
MAGLIDQLDAKIAEILSGWSIYTTLIALLITAFLVGAIVYAEEPDVHPMLLARGSSASMVRQPGESAIYRSHDAPHGYPLRAGLQVKYPGAPPYSGGKNGDLRDIWRRVTGELPLEQGASAGQPGKIFTILGKEQIVDNKISDVTQEIIVIGSHFVGRGSRRVVVYLPNSIELLSTIFAGAFYGFTTILLPYNQPHARVVELLRQTNADALVAQAGSLPLDELIKAGASVTEVIWVAERASRHVGWGDVPESIGRKIGVSVWHELVKENRNSAAELPTVESGQKPGNIVAVWQGRTGAENQVVEFTQGNMVAAVAALIYALPSTQRMNPSDLFLPVDSLTHTYTLALTLAALFCRATVAINSVAGPGVQISLAARTIAPTIIAASAETAAKLHSDTSTSVVGSMKKLAHALQTKALDAGRMPVDSILTRLNAPTKANVGATPGKLRLLFVSERAGADTPPLSSEALSDLRVFTGARVIYALTAARVCGAVAQTDVYDYRRELGTKHCHFGVPLSSVEVKLKDTGSHRTTDEKIEGSIVVSGPAVAGQEAELGIVAKFRDDNTLAYV